MRAETTLDPSQLKAKIREVERELDAMKAIKTALKGAVNGIGKAEDSLNAALIRDQRVHPATLTLRRSSSRGHSPCVSEYPQES